MRTRWIIRLVLVTVTAAMISHIVETRRAEAEATACQTPVISHAD